jgi:hypothetical protein
MQEQEIINLAKIEIDKDPSINFVSLPKTKAEIQKLIGDKPLSVWGLRTYAKRYRTIYEYLIIKVYPDTWREQFQKIKLNQARTL